mmetsp:Transcript_30199/g.39798  ORF Transcript_30199/g.39798 Transcript_30199/m.39798 type:complete len:150 (-) Transcript_30199:144-593(-)|eukprot:CAMPEP_0117760596 /NCGR_PEP_ID=MMETSP0947-20121206/16726_1 /TAXON_ID=44440 /ORGANISM="Chattonella subsalsa, Strain CCMP2191" /LENGTH=149 /DNA_ID=CAMNT_0005581321 /DNA_START=79 /DNA_END=528 /DNA_ORIENTATION=-
MAFTIEVTAEYGYIIALSLAFYLHQQIALVIPVVKARISTGIKAPTLYPRDSEIKNLQLSDLDVTKYMQAQRAHQNNVEFTSVFMAQLLVAGLYMPKEVAIAGAITLVGRILTGFGYLFGKRAMGGFFHFGEWYILYVMGRFAYAVLSS